MTVGELRLYLKGDDRPVVTILIYIFWQFMFFFVRPILLLVDRLRSPAAMPVRAPVTTFRVECGGGESAASDDKRRPKLYLVR